jgi:hypothetical protein
VFPERPVRVAGFARLRKIESYRLSLRLRNSIAARGARSNAVGEGSPIDFRVLPELPIGTSLDEV